MVSSTKQLTIVLTLLFAFAIINISHAAVYQVKDAVTLWSTFGKLQAGKFLITIFESNNILFACNCVRWHVKNLFET